MKAKLQTKRVFGYIFILFTCLCAYAEELIVPAIKAPYSFENAQWDNSGDSFAYEVNGNVYIRNSLSLLLKDSYKKNRDSEISAFYASPNKVDYPKVLINTTGNSVTVKTYKNSKGLSDQKIITDLPARVKEAAINREQTYLAFLGTDSKAYIYDIEGKRTVVTLTANQNAKGIYFTKKGRIIFSDSDKSAGLYTTSGQKLKTYTNANSIKGLALSPDEESLVAYDYSGVVNFYNVNSANLVGYIPNLGSRDLRDVKISKDSRKFLIVGANNTLYVASLKDFLFAPDTVAPTPKQFAFDYKALDPNNRSAKGVTEFVVKDYTDDTGGGIKDVEYITSTQEKVQEKQNFDLERDVKADEPVVITKQPQQLTFPSTVQDTDKEVTFTDKNDKVQDLSVKVREYQQTTNSQVQQKEQNPNYVYVQPQTGSSTYNRNYPYDESSNYGATTPGNSYAQGNSSQGYSANGTGKGGQSSGYGTNGSGGYAGAGGQGAGGYGNAGGSGSAGGGAGGYGNGQASGNASASNGQAGDDGKKSSSSKKQKKSLSEKLKEIQEYKDEDVVLKYKDGHGLLINAGVGLLPSPFVFDVGFPVGYRNYKLLKPFYFGGTLEPFVGFSKYAFPYSYSLAGYNLESPKLLGARVYSPFGFCMYPLKNQFEVYCEVNAGASFTWIWDGHFGQTFLAGSVYPAFFSSIKIGATWDIFNLSICGTYDTIMGFSFRVETGIVIRLQKKMTVPANSTPTEINNLRREKED